MTDKPENPQAFPEHKFESYGSGAGQHVTNGGMTLRDYFAGQAVAGLTTRSDVMIDDDTIAFIYAVADAMIKERLK